MPDNDGHEAADADWPIAGNVDRLPPAWGRALQKERRARERGQLRHARTISFCDHRFRSHASNMMRRFLFSSASGAARDIHRAGAGE